VLAAGAHEDVVERRLVGIQERADLVEILLVQRMAVWTVSADAVESDVERHLDAAPIRCGRLACSDKP